MGETEFNTLAFEKRLIQLKDTQESIQSLSSWCLKQRAHHKKIVSSWLNVLKRVKVEQRLVLFYLANDVIQYSKRKNYEFVESWGLNLQKATPLVRDEKVRPKILRIFKIWEQRSVYDDEFLSDLTGLLSAGANKKTDDDPLDFQPQQLVNKIKQCAVLEADTDLRLKYIHESHLELSDADALCANLKDRSNKDDVEKELDEGISCVERYTAALQREIVAREALLALLASANQYYSTQRGEVKVVAYAYKNFGARVRALKRKLDELIPTLPPAAPSPPQRDEDVPSPGPDEDLELPAVDDGADEMSYNIDKTFNTSLSADGSLYNLGLSSFLSSDNPLSLFDSQNDSTNANITAQVTESLPGLDLLADHPPPPVAFYRNLELPPEEPQPYRPEESGAWNTTAWEPVVDPPRSVPPPARFPEPPASPPHLPVTVPFTPPEIPPVADVDHRGILPPPPPPPVLPMLGGLEDVDHRLLPSIPLPPLPQTSTPVRHCAIPQDVDHRNLISLTSQLPPQRPMNTIPGDQDYQMQSSVPTMVPPPDIVESVDMDLSEDEEQREFEYNEPKEGMYQQASQVDHSRRQSFNNKILVGGDNGKTNHNLIRINSLQEENYKTDADERPHTAPIMPPLSNPFDKMSPVMMQFQKSYGQKEEDNSNDSAYEEDLRSRGMDNMQERNVPHEFENDWQNNVPRFANQRFPRNWGPRTNFRPPGFGQQQFWPRNGPRPPNRWIGPRGPRFW